MSKVGAVRPYLVALVCLVALSIAYYFVIGLVFPVDDAYIVTHNVQVLFNGDEDMNFDGASALTGTTSVVDFSLIAVLSFFCRPLFAQYLVVWLAAALYVMGLTRLGRIFRMHAWELVCFVLLGVTVAQVPYQLLNGLETGLAMGAVLWVLICMQQYSEGWVLPILCGLLPYIRPELAAFSLLILMRQTVHYWRSSASVGVVLKRLLRFLLLVGLGFLPWAVWYYLSLGVPYPSTIVAKKHFYAESHYPLFLRGARVLWMLLLFLAKNAFLIVFLMLLPRTEIGKWCLGFMLIVLAAYLQFPGGLYHYEHRYLYIFIPLLLFALAQTFEIESCKRLRRPLLLGALAYSLLFTPYYFEKGLEDIQFTKSELEGVSQWSKANLPVGSRLLVHDVGYISYARNFDMVDLVGLKTESSMREHKNLTFPTGGAKRPLAMVNIAKRSAPDYLVVLSTWDRIFGITQAFKEYDWKLIPLRTPPQTVEKFYEVYRLAPPKRQRP